MVLVLGLESWKSEAVLMGELHSVISSFTWSYLLIKYLTGYFREADAFLHFYSAPLAKHHNIFLMLKKHAVHPLSKNIFLETQEHLYMQ